MLFVQYRRGTGGKEKGTAPADHTTAPAHSSCLDADTCCKYGPTLTCKTARCEFRKATRVWVSCRCHEWCVNSALPQTRRYKSWSKGDTEGMGTGKRKWRWGKLKGGQPSHQTPRTRTGRVAKEMGEGKAGRNKATTPLEGEEATGDDPGYTPTL